jgi:GNAT superfamily N-acetyltransferase
MRKRARRPLRIGLEASELSPAAPGGPPRLLGRLDLDAVRRELEEAGVLARLAARGYLDPVIRIEVEEGEHRLLVVPREGGPSLVDLRMEEGALASADPVLRARGLDPMSVIAVHWLALQDPRASFTPGRPRLPGQSHPGLGLGRHLYTRVLGWAEAWGKDALVNVPAYFHNARFYAPPFAFLSAPEQGRFEALVRDVSGLAVAEASAAVEKGRVVDAATGQVAAWAPGPMVAALSPSLREFLASDDHARAVAAAREAHRFALRGERSSR